MNIKVLCHAKVSQLDKEFVLFAFDFLDEDVLELDVAMDDLDFVQVVQADEDLLGDVADACLGDLGSQID